MLALDIVKLDGEGIGGGEEFVFAEQQRRRAALRAPPLENGLTGRQFARRDLIEHAQKIEVREVRVVLAGRRRAVKDYRDEAVFKSLLQFLHQLVEQLFHGRISPVARSAAATEIAAAESSETVARIGPFKPAAAT